MHRQGAFAAVQTFRAISWLQQITHFARQRRGPSSDPYQKDNSMKLFTLTFQNPETFSLVMLTILLNVKLTEACP